MSEMNYYERRLQWLRTFRGYTEDEAELAAWAADEIERLTKRVKELENLPTDCPEPPEAA